MWTVMLGGLLFVFTACEAYISRETYPFAGTWVTKIQHSFIAAFPVVFLLFWRSFVPELRLKRLLQVFAATAAVLLMTIWLTHLHQSGPYVLQVRNPGSIFEIRQWQIS